MKSGFRPKMLEQTYLEVRGAEIVQELALRSFRSLERRLRLDDKPLVDDHVDSVDCQNVPLVRHVRAQLASNTMSAHVKLPLESHDVDVLEKSEAESVVDLIERANDRARKPLFQ